MRLNRQTATVSLLGSSLVVAALVIGLKPADSGVVEKYPLQNRAISQLKSLLANPDSLQILRIYQSPQCSDERQVVLIYFTAKGSDGTEQVAGYSVIYHVDGRVVDELPVYETEPVERLKDPHGLFLPGSTVSRTYTR